MSQPMRGTFIIINNKTFNADTRKEERAGTDEDAIHLETDFRKLGFQVQRYDNQTAQQMLKLVLEAEESIDAATDCFGLAVLSHGDADVVWGTNKTISIDNLVGPIKGCEKLIGKPKIFIIQACRGQNFDEGVEMHDGASVSNPSEEMRTLRVPFEADVLYAYSTVQCYYSWRNSQDGSWYIQAMHIWFEQCFDDASIKSIDFLKLLTRVNNEVAYNFESQTRDPSTSNKKQIPSIVSMLTKDLIFKIPR